MADLDGVKTVNVLCKDSSGTQSFDNLSLVGEDLAFRVVTQKGDEALRE